MKSFMKILAVVIAIATVFTSSVVFTQAADAEWPDDPVLTYRDDFDWGTVIHDPSWGPAYNTSNLETQLHQIKEMGGSLLRVDAVGNVGVLDKTVKLCNAYGIKVMIIVYIPGATYDPEVEIVPEDIEQHFSIYAKRYDGNQGCGKVDYIQLDNEMDVKIMGWTNMNGYGTEISEYPRASLEKITEQVRYAVRGIRSGNPNVKIIINIAYVHYGFLKFLQQSGIEWDITGHDWYSDMFNIGNESNFDVTNRDLNFHNAGKDLYDLFGKPIIICETNQWANQYNAHTIDKDGYPAYDSEGVYHPEIKESMLDGSYWDPLVLCLEDYYNQDYVIGCTFYEFYDELLHQGSDKEGTTFLGEANFGMMKAGISGAFIEPKPIYYRCKKIFGGGPVQKLDWPTVEAMFEDKDEEQQQQQQGGAANGDTQSGLEYGTTTNHTYTTFTPEPIVVTPDPINKEITQTETVYRKVPVSSGKFWTWPIIVSFIVGGLAVFLAAGAVTYVLIKRKKTTAESVK